MAQYRRCMWYASAWQLANIDYVHGVAESLLGVTNITLAMIFYRALEAAKRENGGQRPEKWR